MHAPAPPDCRQIAHCKCIRRGASHNRSKTFRRQSVLDQPGKLKCFALAVLIALSGCRHYVAHPNLDYVPKRTSTQEAPEDGLQVYFLGTAGVYLQATGVSLLADPFFTNPSLLRALFPVSTASNTDRIKQELGALPRINELQSILVSHSHYDHALDVPFTIARFRPACVYGSETLRLLLGPDSQGRFCSLKHKTVDPTQGSVDWIRASPRVRIAAIRSEHFSHFLGITYADGEYKRSPDRLSDWRTGETYSFIIDILRENYGSEPMYRIFYLPSAAKHPIGTPPPAILEDGKQIDLAIIGAAQLEKDPGYPGAVLQRIRPAAVMLVHWDDFFDDYGANPRMNFRVSPKKIAERLKPVLEPDVRVYWPARGAALLCKTRRSPPAAACAPQ